MNGWAVVCLNDILNGEEIAANIYDDELEARKAAVKSVSGSGQPYGVYRLVARFEPAEPGVDVVEVGSDGKGTLRKKGK